LIDLERELANKQETFRTKLSKWQHEKELILKMKANKEKMETLRLEADEQERKFEYQAVARIRYNDIPAIQKENEQIEQDMSLIREK
jgi:ATP-dependent Clp protease ATP-binding subunit ClpB